MTSPEPNSNFAASQMIKPIWKEQPQHPLFSADKNPFAVSKLEALEFNFGAAFDTTPADTTLDAVIDRIVRCNGALRAIIGPCGTGKTTLLASLYSECLRLSLNAAPPVKINDQHTVLNQLNRVRSLVKTKTGAGLRPIVFVDSAERLGSCGILYLRLLARNTQCMVITLHQQRGVTPLVCTKAERDVMLNLLSTLLAPINLGQSEYDAVRATAQVRFTQFNGNIREVFRSLYDDFAG